MTVGQATVGCWELLLEGYCPQVSPNILLLLERLQPMAWTGALFTRKHLVG